MFAEKAGVTTILITGKGEPTLAPRQITDYLNYIKEREFPFIELQSNMLRARELRDEGYLSNWYEKGLNTVCISIVHYDNQKNSEIYTPGKDYPDLSETIGLLHEKGFTVRLSCVGVQGYIDTYEKLQELTAFAKENGVEQVSYCPMTNSGNTQNSKVSGWINKNSLKFYVEIVNTVRCRGTILLNLVHGAQVFDLDGQNLCLKNCLTRDPLEETVRQLIFFPDGKLTYDWEYEGARIL